MKLHVLPAGPIQTNAYLLTEPQRGEAVLVDAPEGIWAEIEPILARTKCQLTELWLTHGHWDHTQGAAEVVRETKAKVRAHEADRALYETPQVMSAFLAGKMKLEPVFPDHWVRQGEKFKALGATFEVRHVPGHCPRKRFVLLAEFARRVCGRRAVQPEHWPHGLPGRQSGDADGVNSGANLHAARRNGGLPRPRV